MIAVDEKESCTVSTEDGKEQAKSAAEQLVKIGKRCTHMGCTLAKNSEDEALDSPCHGSRFDMAGEVLWRPAVKRL